MGLRNDADNRLLDQIAKLRKATGKEFKVKLEEVEDKEKT